METEAPETSSPVASARQVAGNHYKEMGVEPWDVIDTWPLEQRIGAYRAGALKYLMRMGSKDERLQEIRKGGHYNEKLAEVLAEAAKQEADAQVAARVERAALLQRILDAYSPDDTITDYQNKIRQLIGAAGYEGPIEEDAETIGWLALVTNGTN